MRPSRIQTITSVACGKKGETQAATHDLYNLCKLESYKQYCSPVNCFTSLTGADLLKRFYLNVRKCLCNLKFCLILELFEHCYYL